MEQLEKLKRMIGNPENEDEVLDFCLDTASEIICDIRNSDIVEKKYFNAQIRIAIEIYNKMGAEGQTSHGENGINRTYEAGDISNSVISRVTPIVKTPSSEVRVIDNENP